MTENKAVAYMEFAMIPFYIITAMAPVGRALVDRYGLRIVMLADMILLVIGCMLCAVSGSLAVYLTGNALIVFCCSLDIQNLYIVTELPESRRAGIQGLAGGIAAVAAMVIPVIRRFITHKQSVSWKWIYMTGGVFALTAVFVCLVSGRNHFRIPKNNNSDTFVRYDETRRSWKPVRREIRTRYGSLILVLLVLGVATPAVTFYNEPMLTFSGMGELNISIALLIQPVVLLVVQIISGFAADRLGRKKVAIANIILACLALLFYVVILRFSPGFVPILSGVAWGMMVGCYFAGQSLLTLMMLELSDLHTLGRISALSTYAYGIGDAVGIGVSTILVGSLGMGITKLVVGIPVLVISVLICLKLYPR
ncbi:MAG: MFS transporter [Wujia sp.]